MSPDPTLLPDLRLWIRATVPLLEVESDLRPERRTAHHAVNGRKLLARLDRAIPRPEPDA